ncbi:hypothetical protein HYQ46_006088 [Verticillium longisporum]|nr:hypothetical protein HYQ46_006088 [Verticillium longisporum]
MDAGLRNVSTADAPSIPKGRRETTHVAAYCRRIVTVSAPTTPYLALLLPPRPLPLLVPAATIDPAFATCHTLVRPRPIPEQGTDTVYVTASA